MSTEQSFDRSIENRISENKRMFVHIYPESEQEYWSEKFKFYPKKLPWETTLDHQERLFAHAKTTTAVRRLVTNG